MADTDSLLPYSGNFASGLATSRARSINSCTTGLTVRLFRVMIPTGQGGIARFADALELAPQDRPSQIFLDRCRYYQTDPPADAWNGVWIMEQK